MGLFTLRTYCISKGISLNIVFCKEGNILLTTNQKNLIGPFFFIILFSFIVLLDVKQGISRLTYFCKSKQNINNELKRLGIFCSSSKIEIINKELTRKKFKLTLFGCLDLVITFILIIFMSIAWCSPSSSIWATWIIYGKLAFFDVPFEIYYILHSDSIRGLILRKWNFFKR